MLGTPSVLYLYKRPSNDSKNTVTVVCMLTILVYQIPIVNYIKPNLNQTMIWIHLGKWLSANKLSSNLVKTEYMLISASVKLKALDYRPIIELKGKPIARAVETPSLGLIIDEALTWEPYIQLLRTKIASAISAIKQPNFLSKKIFDYFTPILSGIEA